VTRVLRVIARLNIGGPAIQAISLTRLLEPLGYETMLVRGVEGPREGTMDHLAEEMGVSPVRMDALRREIGPHDAAAVAQMTRIIRRFRPHVLHTHTAKAGTIGRAAALLAGGAAPPVRVHTFHGHVFKGEFSSARKEAAFVRIERFLGRSTTRLVAVSEEVRRDLIELRVAEPEKIEVVRLGFDLAPFAADEDVKAANRSAVRRELGVPENAKLVAVVARVVRVKRIDRFVELAASFADDPNAYFVVVGDGDLRDELQAGAAAQRLGPRLIWAGFRLDIPAICHASDVVALTSANEGTPVCLIEAQAAGVPVVSTDVGGVRTVIRDGVTGFVVNENDERGVHAAVRSLLSDEDLAASMGREGVEHSLGMFGRDRLVADIDSLYRRLLRERGLANLPADTLVPAGR
jgi:glycosyltransferase involved in cell wall biosynthesis